MIPVVARTQVVTVVNQETEEPLELVTLATQTPVRMVLTNGLGQADITAMANAGRIEIRMLGFETTFRSWEQLKTAGFRVGMKPAVISLDRLVISATRWNQSSWEIPAKISTIPASQTALQMPQTAADLLGVSGKVFVQKSQQGGGSPMIRGFATNRLLYSVDGVRMNTAIFRAGNIQNVISLDPFAIGETEVLFGPGSVIYGSDAIGGVMSFATLKPTFSAGNKPITGGSAVTRYASANQEMTAHFDVHVGWKKWAILTSISSFNFGDLKMGSYGPEEYLRPFYVVRQDSADVIVANNDPRVQRPSGYTQMNLMQKVAWKPNDAWYAEYAFHYSETSEYSRYDRHIRYKKGLPRYGEWSYGPQKWMMNQLTLSHQNAGTLLYDQLTLRLAHQQFEESRIDRDINKSTRHIREEKVNALSANLDFSKRLSDKHQLFYGLEGVMDDVASTGTDMDISTGIAAVGPSRYPQALWSTLGIYLSEQWKMGNRLLLHTGIRYSRYMIDADFDTAFYPFPFTVATLNEGALTGSAGLVYRPSDRWVLSTNLSTGFRAPNVDDLGKVFDSAPGLVVVPNPDLKPEYAWNADLGAARIFGDYLKLDISVYATLLQDALVRRDFTLNGQDSILYDGEMSKVQAIQNAAEARVYGVQAGLEAKLPAGFGFTSDFNYQKGEEELDDGSVSPSRHAAPWFGVTRLTYGSHSLKLEINAQYSGKKTYEELPEEEKAKTEIYALDDDGNPWSPGWYTLNFKALYKLNSQLSVTAGIENITDQRYRPYSSGICAAGRNFMFGLKAGF
ncbi:MAG TPA: TonB-dependent receptor [Bacteroidales bacterium]|nr:TonB-dependent receptor [Bacteroidales bacterium]HRZ48841.1 TonB-dependent receptor [Bacteroidales bacterium]